MIPQRPPSEGDAQALIWTSSSSPFIKINVDASWCASNGEGFTGTVVRDDARGFLAAARSSIKAGCAAWAEALTILHGCQLGFSLGYWLVMVEFDLLESVLCLKDSLENGSWEAFPALAKVKHLGKSFQDCR